MVKLNLNILIKSTSGQVFRKPDESHEQYLMKVTHLYLENKQLESIGREIFLCTNLTVIYLYDNCLPTMPDLSGCLALTHIYIQNNSITRIEHIGTLPNLTKLYIGRNRISFVEGFHGNGTLQELYIENQDLLPGEKLLFDPRSVSAIAATLTIINISGNNIDSLAGIAALSGGALRQLIATDNRIDDLAATIDILSSFHQLRRVELQHNPICAIKKYRDSIIVAVALLESLDGKDITDTSRRFLVNWKANKDANDRKREDIRSKNMPSYLTANEMRFSSTPHNRNFPPARYSGSIGPPFPVSSK